MNYRSQQNKKSIAFFLFLSFLFTIQGRTIYQTLQTITISNTITGIDIDDANEILAVTTYHPKLFIYQKSGASFGQLNEFSRGDDL